MIVIRLNMNLLNYLKGTILKLTNNGKGVKLSSFWKRRIKDSAIDNCVTVLKGEERKNFLKDFCESKSNIPEDPKEYYDDLAKEIKKEDRWSKNKGGKKPKKKL